MLRLLTKRGYSPIGVDIGDRSVKLLQFNADRRRVIDAARQEFSTAPNASNSDSAQPSTDPAQRTAMLAEAIRAAREARNFKGREAVLSLGSRELFVQNVRVPKAPPGETERLLRQEAASRLPFPAAEAEIRFVDAADVRQGDTVKREVILLACHRPELEQLLAAAELGGLKPIAVDVEPLALLRCYSSQFRRDEDRQQRAMFIHIGASSTVVVIAHGSEPLFVKYIELGGRNLDEAVATQLKMDLAAAANLRRHNGDRRADQQDPEITRSVQESTRPVVDRLAAELAMCVRYHSVTFRGQPLMRVIIGGGESTAALADDLAARLDLKCELGDPLRNFELAIQTGRRGQWDIAVGMALRQRIESN